MTQYIYLASPIRLPQGSFGQSPLSPEQPNVFNSELDFAHLYFENNYDSQLKQRFSYSQHFSFKHQVAADARDVPLKLQLQGTAEEAKCLSILHAYIEEALQESGIVEYFTSQSGKEDSGLAKKRHIRWSDVKDPYDLVIDDLEFWEITLS
ncbi:hypothetical protein [Oceanobacillus sp. AG]|uniref:hypothetical protein n=1 Tax=Oceanobacillus sp. AG TaxID=2681969 RepID=UPI0012EBE04F|nr:hypothetical protein [Oceanobacillus sp. AG]